MIPLVADNLLQIAKLCREHRIQTLDLIGSAATGEFDPASSDVDFICDLGEYEPGVADRLFSFAEALEALLGRKVDLLTEPMVRNPWFRQAVDEQRVRIHAASDRPAAA